MPDSPPVRPTAPLTGPALVPLGHHQGKPPIALVRPVNVIGSRSTARIHLISNTVSKAHALLVRSNGRCYIRDLASRTKLYVNGEETREALLDDGDLIRIGSFEFKYIAAPDETNARPPARQPIAAKLEVAGSDFPVPIEQRVTLIGRRSTCDIRLLEDSVSTAHAVIFELNGQRYIRDLGSRAGTFVNGVSTHQHQLSPGDLIRTGETEMRYLPSVREESLPAPAGEGSGTGIDEILAVPAVDEPPVPAEPAPPDEAPLELAQPSPMSEPEPAIEPAPLPLAVDQPVPPVVEEPVAPEPVEAPIISADKSIEAPALSVQPPPPPESSSAAGIEADKQVEPTEPVFAGEAEEAKPADLRPRRGWRGALADEDQTPGEADEDVLKFPDSISAGSSPLATDDSIQTLEPTGAGESSTAVLDQESLQADAAGAAEPELLELPARSDGADEPTDLGLAAGLSDLIESVRVRSDDPLQAVDLSGLAIAEQTKSEEPIIPTVQQPQPTVHSEEPAAALVEASPLTAETQEQAPPEQSPRPLIVADALRSAPVDEPPTIQPPVGKPRTRRWRKPRKQALEPVDASAAPATEAPDEQAARIEVLEPTEPTSESALRQPAAQLDVDTSRPAEPASAADELTDTTFARAVQEFTGAQTGDLVEAAAEQAVAPEPAPATQIPWGANQDNFLGGSPIDLRAAPSQGGAPSAPAGDQAVKDLIEEIDTAAEAAQRAAKAPSEDMPAIIPAIPPRPRRAGALPPRRRRQSAPSPFAGDAGAPDRELTTAFDGLAMPPVRDTDVFAQMSPPAVDEQILSALSGRSAPSTSEATKSPRRRPAATAEEIEAAAAAIAPRADAEEPLDEETEQQTALSRRTRVRPAIPEPMDVALMSQRRPEVTYAAELSEAESAAVRRRYLRRIPLLLGAMILLMAVTVMAVYGLMGVPTLVEGSMKYKNLSAQTRLWRDRFVVEQRRMLMDDVTRHRAKRLLNERDPEVSYGLLDNREQYLRLAERAASAEHRPDVLLVRYTGSNPRADGARVRAMLAALYERNSLLIEDARSQRRDLENLTNSIERSGRRLEELSVEIERLRVLGEKRPTSEQIEQLQTDVARLEKAWNDSVVAMKSAEAELAQVKSEPAELGGTSATTQPVADDEKLRAMQAQLDELLARVGAARQQASEQSAAARKALDDALDAFQKQIADAQQMMEGNPELAAYVQAAQKLQQTIRQLTDELIRRQEQQFGRLMELRQRLNEKMEQRRMELWQADQQLQDLTERLAILTRQHNAAVGGGLQKEADDLRVEIDLTRNLIKARQDLLPGDSFYADAIQQLQLIIDSTRRNIDEDRKKTEQLLTTLQQGFTASAPAVEKMPQEQRLLAQALASQLEAINAARSRYNQAADASASDGDAQAKSQIATLQAGIDARRQQLAEQNLKTLQDQQEQQRLSAVQEKQKQFESLAAAETEARQAYFARHKELREAQTAVAEAKASGERLDETIRQKDIVQRQLQAQQAQLENKQQEASRAVEPLPPGDNDVVVSRGPDNQLLVTLISCGVILAAFTGLILWTLRAAAMEAPVVRIQAADLSPTPPPRAQSSGPPPAQAALPGGTDDDADEDDREPAVV